MDIIFHYIYSHKEKLHNVVRRNRKFCFILETFKNELKKKQNHLNIFPIKNTCLN